MADPFAPRKIGPSAAYALIHSCCLFQSIVLLSLMFCTIGVAGLVGNLLVVIAIVANKKMRHSATNLFIITMLTAAVML